MSGTIKINNIQLGDSATASQNFVLSIPATPDGTVKLSRGNVGATTQDVFTIDAAGIVHMPQVPAFSVNGPVQSISSTWTRLTFNNATFNIGSAFDITTNSRFQPSVPGYYQLNGLVQVLGTSSGNGVTIYKNGVGVGAGGFSGVSNTNPAVNVSSVMYLNGTTDYVELWAYSLTTLNTANQTFSGFLARAA